MAIVVLVLWLFTAGAGFYLLVTSNLGRVRPAVSVPAAPSPSPAPASTGPSGTQATPGAPTAAPQTAAAPPALAAAAGSAAGVPASRREMRRATRDRWDPPSLTAAKQAPVIPGAQSLLEFAHPACGLIGLAFWLGFTLVHNKALGWIAFGLIAVTACLGLTWFTASVRAPSHGRRDRSAPSFSGRLMALHGSAAAVTITLAALTALVARG